MYVPTGEDVREARTARGLGQTEVAKRAGISQPMLSRIENEDVDPRLPTLHAVAAALNESDPAIEADDLEVALPEALRGQRVSADLTQTDLAEEAGVSQPLIARIENGDVNPRASTLRAILDAVDVSETRSSADSETDAAPTSRTTDDGASTVAPTTEPASRDEGSILASIESSFEQLRE